MSTFIASMAGALITLGGAVAALPAAHRAAGSVAAFAAIVVAAVLALGDTQGFLDPQSWLLSIAVTTGALSQLLRLERVDDGQKQTEIR